jgi:site-specific recombinase XerD
MHMSAVCKLLVKGLNRNEAERLVRLDNGSPLDVIGHILGHDNIDVTAHYAQVSTRLIVVTYDRAHPHANTFHQ